MIICYQCGEKAYIKYGGHWVCSKHYTLAVNEVFSKVINSYGIAGMSEDHKAVKDFNKEMQKKEKKAFVQSFKEYKKDGDLVCPQCEK
jgi:hypothetical protein